MAERPVFVPVAEGDLLVQEIPISFKWHPGFAPSQKQKSVCELHQAATSRGIPRLLEVSSKSDREIGRRLSAFHQKVFLDGRRITLESAFQGSKKFENGGPYVELYDIDPKSAKRDPRLRSSGRLISFVFSEKVYPINPQTAFYDWLFLNAILPEREWLRRLTIIDGFTDIEFNPERSINCQARSCAMFIALLSRNMLDEAMSSFDRFVEIAYPSF